MVNIIADLRDATAAEQMVDTVERDFGAVDVLVNSAGAITHARRRAHCCARHDAMQAKFFTLHPRHQPADQAHGRNVAVARWST